MNKKFINLSLLVLAIALISAVYFCIHGLNSRYWFDNLYDLRNVFNIYNKFVIGLFLAISGPLFISLILRINCYFSAFIVWIVAIIFFGKSLAFGAAALFVLSSYLLGELILRKVAFRAEKGFYLVDALALGFGLYAIFAYVLIFFPVNYPLVYLVLLLLPIVANLKHIKKLFSAIQDGYPHKASWGLIDLLISSLLLYYGAVALMPEIGHDALVMHLFIPEYIAWHHIWDFDASRMVFAVSPILGDLMYLYGVILGGETAARIINFQFSVLLIYLVYELSLWVKFDQKSAKLAALIFACTPLVFLENSSLYIDSIWSFFIILASVSALKINFQKCNIHQEYLLFCIMSGLALATKALTLLVFPCLLLVFLVRPIATFKNLSPIKFLKGIALFALVGLPSYITSYVITKNPVFPFFNQFLNSPYWAAENFQDLRWPKGVHLNSIYEITFNSQLFIEGSFGAAGFQWVLLPIVLCIGLLFFQARVLVLLALGFITFVVLFQSVAYLRYILPAFIWVTAALGGAFAILSTASKLRVVYLLTLSMAIGVIFLNATHLHSATYYGSLALGPLSSSEGRNEYLRKNTPIRSAVDILNELNTDSSPVALFVQSPAVSGLRAPYQSATWYGYAFNREVSNSKDKSDLRALLNREGIKYLIVEDRWGDPDHRQMIQDISSEIASVESISIRRLDER